ncbi:TAM domain methyltransferase [Colletotrichum higginsianum IMI 349063]|uniref:TAM domain methyltransferase n=1 Tax=Colletotrichum higginsianum (strain IMI 349063) TaxID=759273 RepID=A0A1B7XS65_COLHI|nr:TAM domain methyltransferase [Colletotrichum higginsianum IMI 349063]OBR02599.1 TAM domain methyltransferase [Colletotrichum higginsianum IMI 349063]
MGVSVLESSSSMTSSIMQYREENGRTYHAFREGRYVLPNDAVENDRLGEAHKLKEVAKVFHRVLTIEAIQTSNIIYALSPLMRSYSSVRRARRSRFAEFLMPAPALASGPWILVITTTFNPGSQATDERADTFFRRQPTSTQRHWSPALTSVRYSHYCKTSKQSVLFMTYFQKTKLSVPPNVTFYIDDLEDDWTYSYKFDFVYGRMLTGSIADWPRFIHQSYEFLEPGGWIELTDILLDLQSDDGTVGPDCAAQRWAVHMREAAAIWKRPLDSCMFYKQQLAEAGFTNVTERVYKWPSNPWPKDGKFKELGQLTRGVPRHVDVRELRSRLVRAEPGPVHEGAGVVEGATGSVSGRCEKGHERQVDTWLVADVSRVAPPLPLFVFLPPSEKKTAERFLVDTSSTRRNQNEQLLDTGDTWGERQVNGSVR